MFNFQSQNKLLTGIDHRAGWRSLQLAARGSGYAVQNISISIRSATKFNAAIAISGEAVINKTVSIDANLNATQRDSAAWAAAKKCFPELIGDMYLDYQLLGKHHDDPNLNQLLLVACSKDHITSTLNELQQWHCEVKVVDVDYYALSRATKILNCSHHNLIAYLDIGLASSIWLVQQGDKILYARSQSIDTLNILQHVQQFLEFYAAAENDQPIDQLILTGECAVSSDADQLSLAIDIPTKIANPFDYIEFENPHNLEEFYAQGPAFMLCFGLALRSEKNHV